MKYGDELPPNPRPIPIVVGVRSKDIPATPWMRVIIRVIEHGWPDATIQRVVSGSEFPYISEVIDIMVDALVKEVGRRHGVWVCHIVPGFSTHYPMDVTASYPTPDISQKIRDVAESGATSMPLIMWDGSMDAWDRKNIIRAYVRDEDLRASVRRPH